MCQKLSEIDILIYHCQVKKAEGLMLLSKTLIYSCVIIQYLVEESVFVVIVYRLLAVEKY